MRSGEELGRRAGRGLCYLAVRVTSTINQRKTVRPWDGWPIWTRRRRPSGRAIRRPPIPPKARVSSALGSAAALMMDETDMPHAVITPRETGVARPLIAMVLRTLLARASLQGRTDSWDARPTDPHSRTAYRLAKESSAHARVPTREPVFCVAPKSPWRVTIVLRDARGRLSPMIHPCRAMRDGAAQDVYCGVLLLFHG